MSKPDSMYPFYFAIPRGTPVEQRAQVPQHLKETFGAEGRIEHVRSELAFRLYRVIGA